MIMTCRLLCALLVLALCCCPYVCAAGSGDKIDKAGEGPKLQDSRGSSNPEKPGAKVTEGIGQSSYKESDSSERPSKTVSAPATPTSTGTGEGLSGAPTSQGGRDASAQQGASEENIILPGSTGDSDKSNVNNRKHNKEVALTGKEVKEQAPTTTTTTAPEAPNDTAMNAEAPTTTTTRAPSRLREIDGSLSSSAWVCAPLLLAVSALAYTAVG
ncbi:putative mucin TcMUCII [Trypanosoma cruzi]|nr:putative mucin TcMUCII [Trypanosoma cruzi]